MTLDKCNDDYEINRFLSSMKPAPSATKVLKDAAYRQEHTSSSDFSPRPNGKHDQEQSAHSDYSYEKEKVFRPSINALPLIGSASMENSIEEKSIEEKSTAISIEASGRSELSSMKPKMIMSKKDIFNNNLIPKRLSDTTASTSGSNSKDNTDTTKTSKSEENTETSDEFADIFQKMRSNTENHRPRTSPQHNKRSSESVDSFKRKSAGSARDDLLRPHRSPASSPPKNRNKNDNNQFENSESSLDNIPANRILSTDPNNNTNNNNKSRPLKHSQTAGYMRSARTVTKKPEHLSDRLQSISIKPEEIEDSVEYSFGSTFCWIIFALLSTTACAHYIYYTRGARSMKLWIDGYIMESCFSVDNLVAFHWIYRIFNTPNKLKSKALTWGMLGAIVFRYIFLYFGHFVLHKVRGVQEVCGVILVYMAFHLLFSGSHDQDNPQEEPVIGFVKTNAGKYPVLPIYDFQGSFFVTVAIDKNGEPIIPPRGTDSDHASGGETSVPSVSGTDVESSAIKSSDNKKTNYRTMENGQIGVMENTGKSNVVRFPTVEQSLTLYTGGNVSNDSATESSVPVPRTKTFATLLFIVVVCQELVDAVFSLDSSGAIAAMIDDALLAYSSVFFAMVTLRAIYFVVDEIITKFSVFQRSISVILLFIGIKMLIHSFYHFPDDVVCVILLVLLFLSVVATLIQAFTIYCYRTPCTNKIKQEKVIRKKRDKSLNV